MRLFGNKQNDIPRRRQSEAGNQPKSSGLSSVFRRNRTITGTTSANVGSVSSWSDLESSRMHVHHLTMKRRKIFGTFVLVVLSIIFLWTLISNFAATPVITLSDTRLSKPIDHSRYETVIQDYLNANPLSRLSFLMDEANLNAYLTQKLPEVMSVSQGGMAGIGEIEFRLSMRAPVAGWKIGGTQYYVDAKGMPFEKNYYLEPSVQIIDNSGAASSVIGTSSDGPVVSNRLLSFVGRVVSIAKSYKRTVMSATLPPRTTRELDIKVSGNNAYIKLSLDRPVGEQIEDMSRALSYLDGRGVKPTYVDIRVSGKAFYK